MPPQSAKVESLQREVLYRRKLGEITNIFNSAPSLNHILVNLKDKILDLIGAERVTIFAIDSKNRELYSLQKTGDDIREIRVPKSFASVTGFTALSRQTVRLRNAYDAAELASVHEKLEFDARWDKATGFRTKQVLATPIMFDKYLIGVIEFLNKAGEEAFSVDDQEAAEEIARMLGVAFYNQNRAARQTKPSGKFSLLVDKGILSEKDLAAAAQAARVNNADLAVALMEQHRVPKEEIGASLSQFYRVPFFDFTGGERIPQDLIRRIPFDWVKKNLVAPVEKRGTALVVAMDDPTDLVRLDGMKVLGIAPTIEVRVALKDDLVRYIHLSYDQPMDPADASMGRLLVELGSEEAGLTGDAAGENDELDETDSAIVRLANQIVTDAYEKGVSDIHIEPNGPALPTTVRFRLDGLCYKYMDLPAPHRNALVQRFKIMATLDIAERRKPQDGKIRFKMGSKTIELRVATIPTAGNNEDVVMRILAASKPHPLDKMGMSERNLREFKAIVEKPYGIILCVGPTGSGKTTTLHSALGYINRVDRKIWTAEDPVEITQPGLRQVQVHPKIDFTFAAAMRSFLRADPDVIMVGEMRDQETAQTGIEASLTGHLVLTTLHTNSAPETIVRLLDMDIDPFNFADSVLGILAQRLARTICASCKETYEAAPEEIEELRQAYGPEAFDARLAPGLGARPSLSRGRGCRECTDTGYRGRLALHELMIGSDEIRRMIVRRATAEELRGQAVREGMSTLLQDGVEKILAGHTDFKQVRAVCIK
ncbi:MAG TPA: ATPase, T2SS/T4P/T4SS family [Candidatus Saccharimonadales bacterium]|nr:ATPase, T2SS/T4P/T4SS family [Candidatus Saccharimonadales bacterium]